MAYDRQSLLLTFLFSINGTDELAQTGLHVSGETTYDSAAALAALTTDQLEDLWEAFFNIYDAAADLRWASYSRLYGMKVAALDTDGNYLTDARIYERETPAAGTQQNIVPQATCVLSLRTNSTLGPANYGRMYLPHCSPTQTTGSPFISPTVADGSALAAASSLSTINDILLGTANIKIMSAKSPGLSKDVTRVGVGNVVDTQRRRRRQLQETYDFEPVTFPV